MIKQITIFQLNDSKEARNFKYMGYDFIQEMDIKLSLSLYNKVYEFELVTGNEDVMDILDDVYFDLNGRQKPDGYMGHSLSTSDIVKVDGKYYYCDSFGWEEVIFPKQAKTYKVTFFTKELEVENVITYHNIDDQGFLLDTIANNIYSLELAEVVKCEAEGESYTAAVNEMIKVRLANLAA